MCQQKTSAKLIRKFRFGNFNTKDAPCSRKSIKADEDKIKVLI